VKETVIIIILEGEYHRNTVGFVYQLLDQEIWSI